MFVAVGLYNFKDSTEEYETTRKSVYLTESMYLFSNLTSPTSAFFYLSVVELLSTLYNVFQIEYL